MSPTKSVMLSLAMLLGMMTLTTAQNDLTLVNEAKGPEVVEAVVDVVRRSCVLPQDNLLLRRLAYVESHDGMDMATFRSGFYGGIWQVTQQMYDETKTAPELSATRDAIRAHLGIDWLSTSWQDLRKPLYSGLAAALYVEHRISGNLQPVGVTSQADFWARSYHPGGQQSTFSTLANLLDVGCHGQADLDIAFLIDTSSSISQHEYMQSLQFIADTTSIFDLNSGRVRVAVITFSTNARIRLDWGQVRSQSDLRQTVLGLQFETGGTDTDKALDLARSQLFSRARNSAVKVAILVTDGRSHDSIDTNAAASNLASAVPGILVLSVGVGDQVDTDELHNIATDPPCKHTFQVQSYGQIDAIREEIQRLSCRAPLPLYVNHTESCELGKCPPYIVTLLPGVPLMVTVNTTCGPSVNVYGSYSNPYPVASQADTHVTVSRSNPGVFYLPASSQQFYLNVEQTAASSGLGCNVIATALTNQVQVVCVDGGKQRLCTPTDIVNYQLATSHRLCP